jgi:VWFA-related protein
MTVLRPGWISAVSAVLLAVLLVCGPTRLASAADVLLVINQISVDRFPEVTVYFTAVDPSGLPITDINKDRLQVLHNGHAVPDLTLDLAESQQDGLAVVIAIDTSGSMKGEPLAQAQAAARQFLDQMQPNDRAAIVSFGQTVQVAQDLTGDRAALDQAIDGLTVNGDTALYDAVFQSLTLAAQNTLGRRAVVVITDGEDTHSRLSLDDVIDKAHETTTPVSVIGFGEVKVEPVQRLTTVTGGTLGVAPDAAHISERAGQIAALLRKQYVLRYRAPDSRPPENELELVLNQDGRQGRIGQRFPAPPMTSLGVSLPDVAAGSTVSGELELRPTILNAEQVDQVEYQLDGATLQTVTAPPYRFTWNTATAPPGEHTLGIIARLGGQTAEQRIPLTVAPAPGAPQSAPAPGAPQSVAPQPSSTGGAEAAPAVTPATAAEPTPPAGPAAAAGTPAAAASPDTGAVAAVPGSTPGAVPGAGNAPQAPASQPDATGQPAATTPATAGTPVVTATSAVTRTPTATPTESGDTTVLGDIPAPVLIGIGTVVAAGIVGLLYAASRKRGQRVVESTATPVGSNPGPAPQMPWPALPSAPRQGVPRSAGEPSDPTLVGRGVGPASTHDTGPVRAPGFGQPPMRGAHDTGPLDAGRIDPGTTRDPSTARDAGRFGAGGAGPGLPHDTGPLDIGGTGIGDFREAETAYGIAPATGPQVGPQPEQSPAGGALSRSTLTVTLAGSPPRIWPLGIDQIIGRAAGPGVIVVNDPQVSRRHARITFEGGHFVYRDLGPMNPTRLDGRTLPNPYILRDGDRLRVGRAEIVFGA